MQKVLVTGANGFVGQHLTRELTSNTIEVVQVGGRAHIDLSKLEEAHKLDFSEVDGVIHLAGLAAVGPSFDDPMRYITTNSTIENNLFTAALAQGVRPRFLIVSTGALYDPKASLPLTEQSATIPSSPYAVSKLTQEQLAGYYGSRGLNVIIARPFNHIGPGQDPGFIVPDLAQQIIAYEKGEQTSIKVGNLDAQRDYTDVRDIARAYRLLLAQGTPGETYNVCSGKALSGSDILEKLLAVAGTTAPTSQDASRMRPADNPCIYGNNHKIQQATGWQPEIDIDQTLTDVIADWRSRN